jgi:predicted HTH transcriptional regulator
MDEEWNEATLVSYISGKVEESLSIDYKASEALGKDNKRVVEITKDVSAFANSAGGRIIYGLRQFVDAEREHLAEKIDPIDRRDFPKEWLEHVINTIQPRPKATIHPIQLSSGPYHAAYVVEVPQSSTAHQARDRRYYKRYNFENRAMEDYEIRDVMRRAPGVCRFCHRTPKSYPTGVKRGKERQRKKN